VDEAVKESEMRGGIHSGGSSSSRNIHLVKMV